MSTYIRRLSPLVFVFLAASAASQSDAQQPDLDREHSRVVGELYRNRSWPRGELRDGIPLAALALDGWIGGELQSDAGLLSRPYFRAGNESQSPSFVVEARVADTVDETHGTLLGWLAGLSTDRKMPEVREWNVPAGEVGFLGPAGAGPRAISWIAFVRGNVAIRVLAVDPQSDPELDMGSIARSLDAAILARRPLPAGALPGRPVITRFTPAKTSVVAGERIRLDVATNDPDGGRAHLEWIVGGPGQGYVEAAPNGSFVLHTTGPGKLTLTLAVTGSTGTFARRSVDITVADD